MINFSFRTKDNNDWVCKKSMYKFIQYNYSFSHKNPSSNLKREIEVSCTTWITITLIEEVLKIMFKLIGYSGCLSS